MGNYNERRVSFENNLGFAAKSDRITDLAGRIISCEDAAEIRSLAESIIGEL